LRIEGKIVLLLSLIIELTVYCQTAVKPEDAQKADELKKKYKNEGIVYLESKDEITFSISKSNSGKLISANLKTCNDAIVIRDNFVFKDGLMYDDQSEIKSMTCQMGGHGSKTPLSCTRKGYESEGIFYDDSKICYFDLNLGTRGLRPTFEYNKLYRDVKYFCSIFFNEYHPTLKKEIKFIVPNWLDLELKEFNFDGYNIIKEITDSEDKKSKVITFKVTDLVALKNEKNAPSICRSYPHLVLLFKNFSDKGKSIKLFNSIADVYAWEKNLYDGIGNNIETIKPLVDNLVQGKKTDFEKIEAIYYWVHDNIRYIAYENGIMGYKPVSAQEVLKNKFGDCKGMANLLKEMLLLAGYDARLTILGTNDLPYDFSIPSLCVANHMICTLILNNKRYFLDGTDDYVAFNDYSNWIQGKQVLIEDGENYIIDQIPAYGKERNKQTGVCQMSLDKDVLMGNMKMIINGEQKTEILDFLAETKSDNRTETFKQFITNGNNNITITNCILPDLTDRENPISLDYNFELSNQVTRASKEEYILLDYEKELEKLEIDSSRANDYEFHYKVFITSHIEFTVPSDRTVNYVPAPIKIAQPDFSFELEYEVEGNKVNYIKTITIDNAVIRKKDFKTWNTCIKSLKQFYNDPLVLIKK